MRPNIIFGLAVLAPLSACGGTWSPKGKMPSPDGKAVAKIEVRLSGASSDNSTKISIDNLGDGNIISPGEVLSAEGAIVDETRVLWPNASELRIILCEARDYRLRARLLRDPVTRDDGSENTIVVKVENWRYSDARKQCIAD